MLIGKVQNVSFIFFEVLLVRAGVIAELRAGALPASERWPVVLLTPGRLPAAAFR